MIARVGQVAAQAETISPSRTFRSSDLRLLLASADPLDAERALLGHPALAHGHVRVQPEAVAHPLRGQSKKLNRRTP